jgi:hypothetical protein
MRSDRPAELVVLTPTAFAPVLGAVGTAAVEALVASRRPGHQLCARDYRHGDGLQTKRAAQAADLG